MLNRDQLVAVNTADPCVEVLGCMDDNAENFDASANRQKYDQYGNSTCIYESCEAIPQTGGCVYLTVLDYLRMKDLVEECESYGGVACVAGCQDSNATNFDASAAIAGRPHGNSVCIYASCDDIPDEEGCLYADAYSAFNDGFNAANCEEYGGTACVPVPGCLDENADNYNADAEVQVDQYGNIFVYTHRVMTFLNLDVYTKEHHLVHSMTKDLD